MQIVAGLSLKNLKPRVWDPESPYYLPGLHAIMVSYADFTKSSAKRRAAMQQTLHGHLGVQRDVKIYLDNGAFFFLDREGGVPRQEYEEFVRHAQPDWYPIPQDFIPVPKMDDAAQRECLRRTMDMNRDYEHDGYVPVLHVSRQLDTYLEEFRANERLLQKDRIALGGIVPNLLRMPQAMPYTDVLLSLRRTRQELAGKQLHVFGLGGTATLHLAALFGIDSLDSAGWRNRAARGIVQLPGRGDRMVAKMGSWRGREPDEAEWSLLAVCPCPACQHFGVVGLKASGIDGFCNRATHNLWTLLEESRQITTHLSDGSYPNWYQGHLDNSIYLPLVQQTLNYAC